MSFIKCKKCRMILYVPRGTTSISFGERLSKVEHQPEALEEFIGELTDFDYFRGVHNSICANQLPTEIDINEEKWEVLDTKNTKDLYWGDWIRPFSINQVVHKTYEDYEKWMKSNLNKNK
ncbi:MAG: hypothetical protein R6U96_04720 [Promethearchaeia archaeon]